MRASVAATALAARLAILGVVAPIFGKSYGNVRAPVDDRGPLFDLAVTSLDVTQTSSTPLFREVEVLCVIENLGPSSAPPKAEVVISRPGEHGPKIMKKATIPESLPREGRFEIRVKTNVWHASTIPYRCELNFPGSLPRGDSDPTDDALEQIYPK